MIIITTYTPTSATIEFDQDIKGEDVNCFFYDPSTWTAIQDSIKYRSTVSWYYSSNDYISVEFDAMSIKTVDSNNRITLNESELTHEYVAIGLAEGYDYEGNYINILDDTKLRTYGCIPLEVLKNSQTVTPIKFNDTINTKYLTIIPEQDGCNYDKGYSEYWDEQLERTTYYTYPTPKIFVFDGFQDITENVDLTNISFNAEVIENLYDGNDWTYRIQKTQNIANGNTIEADIPNEDSGAEVQWQFLGTSKLASSPKIYIENSEWQNS